MYLIRKNNKYYLTYNKDVADKFNNIHNGIICNVELLEEHNIPEKDVTVPVEYAAVTLSADEITSGRPLQMRSPFLYTSYNVRPITTTNINSGTTS